MFEEIGTNDGVGNISNNLNIGKRAAKAQIEFEHALVIGFNASSVDSLERKTTVEALAICEIRRGGPNVSTRIDHETFTRITLMTEKHAASSRFTRRRRRN